MRRTLRIGIIGDFNPDFPSHPATNDAIRYSADALRIHAEVYWLPTERFLAPEGFEDLASYDALWASPGSPYRSKEGALAAIRWARERNWPFVGT